MGQKLHQPFMRNLIKEFSDISFDHMVDRLGHDRFVYNVERLVATSPWTKTVGATKKICLVYRPKDAGDTLLDYLVL